MYIIKTELLDVTIHPKGAELQSIFHKEKKIEYLWDANPMYWAKHSPVLFPIVGTLKNNTYYYEDNAYQLSRHGFARDLNFSVQEQTENSIVMVLNSNPETLVNYPFQFQFFIKYEVQNDRLTTTYGVWNKDEKELFFSVGAHPAFKIPLTDNTTYADYRIDFLKPENLRRWPITTEGLLENEPVIVLENTTTLPLSKSLFANDALVFKGLVSDQLRIVSDKTPHGLEFTFKGFPYLGLWAAKEANFLCIEPWCGVTDGINSNQQLSEKEGINMLSPGELFERTWSARFY